MTPMQVQQIDFLPAALRESSDRRWHRLAYGTVAGIVSLVLSGIGMYQLHLESQLNEQIAALEPRCQAAQANMNELARLQAELQQHQSTAALLAYLRHQWPRSQILSAVCRPLPESIALTELRLVRENAAPPRADDASRRAGRTAQDPKAELARLSDAQRDLKRLREELDAQRVVVLISGVTEEQEALHRYIGTLAESDLAARVELASIETKTDAAPMNADKRSSQFQVRLVLRPGYGQPGGPSLDSKARSLVHHP
jgi:Tfp pilus assembly protein PilN